MRTVLAVIAFAAGMLPTPGAGALEPPTFYRIFALAGGSIDVPPEWEGVWSTTDSTYMCGGPLFSVGGGLDTLCAGTPIGDDGSEPDIMCSGSADATTINVTCTYSEPIAPDCVAELTVTITGTRTSDSYVAHSVTEVAYTGSGAPCDLLLDSCQRRSTRGTRIGPAPAAYCATPVSRSTWGEVKLKYR